MPRNTSGTYTKPDGTTAVTGTPISSSAYNNLANDQASALTDSLSRSGKGGMQADLSMGGKKILNLAPGTADADALQRAQVVTLIQHGVYGGVSTGTANAQVLTPSPVLQGYFPGMILTFVAGIANTGAMTINVSGLGSVPVAKASGSLAAGDITINGVSVLAYNSVTSTFLLLNPKTLGDAASQELDNLSGNGPFRINHASCAFTGSTGAILGSFNWGSVARTGVGTYTISFAPAGVYCVGAQIDFDVADTNGVDYFVQQATRTTSSCVLVTRRGGAVMSPFDFSRVSVNISRIA